MKFLSTRGKSEPFTASDAMTQGLAADGGLFYPEAWPEIELDFDWSEVGFADFAAHLLKPFFEGDPLHDELPRLAKQAFDFPIPLRALDSQTSVLELFHGPTSSFKDVGARFLALAIEAIPEKSAAPRMVLVATSGDTGGAVASAFSQFTQIPVVILYPKGKITARQEKQLTVWGDQVRAFAVDGTFDDCQRLVKEAFASKSWTDRHQLISANSINIGRLLPQMAYFAYASLEYQEKNESDASLIIPSGNLGNATAALWAKQLRFPIRKVYFAHNGNRAVTDYFQTGEWKPRATVSTLANAMDVGSASNFERVRHLYSELEDLRVDASAFSTSDEQIAMTLKMAGEEIWCPHTAAAIHVRNQHAQGDWIVVATAHPAKFDTVLEPLLGVKIPVPVSLERLLALPSKKTEIRASLEELRLAIINQR